MKLIKKLLICYIITFTVGCVHRNNFGQVRPNKIRFSIKNCKDEKVFSKIDTSIIYISEFERQNSRSKYINAYKFYSNNRIAFFTDIVLDKLEELNPEKAHMGYYSTCFESNKIQIAFYHVQSNIYISRKEFEIRNDSLFIKTLESPQSALVNEIYLKKKLSKNELIFKPDW